MKSSVSITLIICGTFLVALPYLHNAFVTLLVTRAMSVLNRDVNLTAPMWRYADIACVIGGVLLILSAIYFAINENTCKQK